MQARLTNTTARRATDNPHKRAPTSLHYTVRPLTPRRPLALPSPPPPRPFLKPMKTFPRHHHRLSPSSLRAPFSPLHLPQPHPPTPPRLSSSALDSPPPIPEVNQLQWVPRSEAGASHNWCESCVSARASRLPLSFKWCLCASVRERMLKVQAVLVVG